MNSKVLIIDDDPVTTSIVSERLKRKGFLTSTVNDPEEYERVFEDNEPDLVLLDLNMPKLNGFDILKEIRKKYKRNELPIIIITSSESKNDLINALDEGANDFISKPLNHKVISAKIRNHMDNILLSEGDKQRRELETIKTMVTTFNHEINNPLAIAFATMYSLKKEQPENSLVQKLEQSLKRIEKVVLQVDKISKGTKLNYKEYAGIEKVIDLDD